MSLRRLQDVLKTKKYFLGLFLLAGVAGLQSIGFNTSRNGLLSKCLKDILKISENV